MSFWNWHNKGMHSLYSSSNRSGWYELGVLREWGRTEVHRKVWSEEEATCKMWISWVCIINMNIKRGLLRDRLRWEGRVSLNGERRVTYRILVGKPEGRRLLGRPGLRWNDNIINWFKEVEWGRGVNRSGSRYGQVANSFKSVIEISGSLKFLKFID